MAQELTAHRSAMADMSMDDMWRLAQCIAKSRLFGMENADQALTLMAISQAEGRHPALAARDYHIIKGTPAKKAEAMLRDFLTSGGRVEWHALSDDVADATFSHPSGGTVRIAWDKERVKKAQLGNNSMHAKYPRQMLRSRCVSEGVRTVCPMATSGLYVPEEVADFAQPKGAPATARAALDTFAGETIDAETGEVNEIEPTDTLSRAAADAAKQGTEAFRAFWATLGKADRITIGPEIEALKATCDEADRARQQAEEDPFNLPPIKDEQDPAQSAPERPAAAGNQRTAAAGPPPSRARDDAWWQRDHLTIDTAKPIEFKIEMFKRIRETKIENECNELLEHNSDMLASLGKSDREDIQGWIAARKAELQPQAE